MNMSLNLKSSLVLVMSLLYVAPTSAAMTLASLLDSMSSIKSSTADFSEERHSSLLKKPMKLSGQLVYKSPGTLIKKTSRPVREKFIITGTTLAVERIREGKKQRHEVLLDQFPALAPVALGLRSVLSGDATTLSKHYDTELRGDENNWTLLLTPKKRAFEEDDWLANIVKLITIKGSGTRVSLVEILEPGGDRSITRIKHR